MKPHRLPSVVSFASGLRFCNLINFLSEGDIKKFPSIKSKLENLENKKKVLELDLDGVRLALQKEGQGKNQFKNESSMLTVSIK